MSSNILAVILCSLTLGGVQDNTSFWGYFGGFKEAVTSVVNLTKAWTTAVEELTSREVKQQLLRRMDKLNSQMDTVVRQKQRLIEDLSAEPNRQRVRGDIQKFRDAIDKMRETLSLINSQLPTQEGFDAHEFEDRIRQDLDGKARYVIEAGRNEAGSQQVRSELERGIQLLRNAQEEVRKCRQALARAS